MNGVGERLHTKLFKRWTKSSEFVPFWHFPAIDMKNTNPTPSQIAAASLEAQQVAIETFLAGLIEQAEKDAEICVTSHAEMTAAELAELDAALDRWLAARANTDSKAA